MRHRRSGSAARDGARASEKRSLSGSGPEFLGSFPRADVALGAALPEVAFLGRSNVGKSSLLNALAGQRIARISATPGKTRALNVFHLQIGRRETGGGSGSRLPARVSLYFLDLPGYGYARASHTERTAFRQLVNRVVERPRLAGVVWLLDIRRDPSVDDLSMQDVFAAAGTSVLAALTKSDKLPRGQRLDRARELRGTLGLPDEQIVVTSTHTGDGIDELREAIVGLIKATE